MTVVSRYERDYFLSTNLFRIQLDRRSAFWGTPFPYSESGDGIMFVTNRMMNFPWESNWSCHGWSIDYRHDGVVGPWACFVMGSQLSSGAGLEEIWAKGETIAEAVAEAARIAFLGRL